MNQPRELNRLRELVMKANTADAAKAKEEAKLGDVVDIPCRLTYAGDALDTHITVEVTGDGFDPVDPDVQARRIATEFFMRQ